MYVCVQIKFYWFTKSNSFFRLCDRLLLDNFKVFIYVLFSSWFFLEVNRSQNCLILLLNSIIKLVNKLGEKASFYLHFSKN